MTQAFSSAAFIQRLVTVKSQEPDNECVVLLLPEGMDASEAGALVDNATKESDEATNNGEKADFWMDWTARLVAAGLTVVGEPSQLRQLECAPWDADTFNPAYLVCENWSPVNLFTGKVESMTRWVMALSGDTGHLVCAQVYSHGWSDLGGSSLAGLKASLDDHCVQDAPAAFNVERTNTLPEWATSESNTETRRPTPRA